MNKSSILFLGALVAMGMVACDDKLPVAPPQANEQGPVLEGFAGATASLSMNSVDLKAELESGAEYISLYTVNAGSSGLSQADIWGELEISNSADFSRSIILSEYEGIVGTVSLNELYESHAQLFGVAPYTQTVYYRIPLYANVDGNTYRMGSVDSYGSTGTFTESNYEPGFEIEETYYIIGDMNNWDPSTCIKLDHSDKSAYDDPNFTCTFTSVGTTYWKIVPPDVYDQVGQAGFDAGSDFWPNLYRGIPSDDNALYGILVQEDGDAPSIPAGEWTITVNMKDFTYNVSGTPAVSAGQPSGIYLRGSWSDNWEALPEYEFLATAEEGFYVLPYLALNADTKFKVADANWGAVNLGGQEGAIIEVGTPFDLDGGSDITLTVDFIGSAFLTKTDSGYVLELTPYKNETSGTVTGIYLRGDMNGWGVDPTYEFKTTAYVGVCELANVSIEKGVWFKVADENWGPIDLGAVNGAISLDSTNSPIALAHGGGNISLSMPFTGNLLLVEVNNSYYLIFSE